MSQRKITDMENTGRKKQGGRGKFLGTAIAAAIVIFIAWIAFTDNAVKGMYLGDMDELEQKSGTFIYEQPDDMMTEKIFFRKRLGNELTLISFRVPENEMEKYLAVIEEKQGNDLWVGRRAVDCHDEEYKLDDMPTDLPFDKVTDNDIGSYKVLAYQPTGTGSRTRGLLFDEKSEEFVYFYYNAGL